MVMIIVFLGFLGLILGSFVNALVWRVYRQEKSRSKKLSITKGRSMCPECRHELAAKDLVPIFSWLSLKGKCRYCKKAISYQYPLVELGTALLFGASYIWWPVAFNTTQQAVFGLWLIILIGLMALLVYDLRWLLLPNRMIYPLSVIAVVQALVIVVTSPKPITGLVNASLAVLIGGGIFYVLFQISGGKWIGGGDVRLGWLLGLLVATPARSVLYIFIASLLGTIVSLPLLFVSKLKRDSVIPFGPFLIVGAIIVVLFGQNMIDWYQQTFLNF
jgi:prepilin signal peptidase PulO-like enzyme (type II secretory pathway)